MAIPETSQTMHDNQGEPGSALLGTYTQELLSREIENETLRHCGSIRTKLFGQAKTSNEP